MSVNPAARRPTPDVASTQTSAQTQNVADPATSATRQPAAARQAGPMAGDANDGFRAAGPTYGRGPRIDGDRPDFNQGQTNACGTTALAIAFHRLGTEVPVAEIDRDIRNFDLFTSTLGIVEHAQGRGFQAERYNGGSFDQLQSDIAAGREVIVLTDVKGRDDRGWLQPGDSSDASLHYMVVTEANVAPDGTEYVTFWNYGREETLPYSEFEKLWGDLKMKDMSTGYDNPYILVDQGSASPLRPSDHSETAMADHVAHGVTEVASGAADIGRGDVLSGGGRILDGLGHAAQGVGTGIKNFVGGLFG